MKPVLVATEVFVMATRFFSVALDFVGSFMRDGDQDPNQSPPTNPYCVINTLISYSYSHSQPIHSCSISNSP